MGAAARRAAEAAAEQLRQDLAQAEERIEAALADGRKKQAAAQER